MVGRLSLFIAVLLYSPTLFAAPIENARASLREDGQPMRLTGKWRFVAADKPAVALAEFDDSQSPLLNVENEWRLQGVEHNQNAWFRLRLLVPASLAGKDLGLIVPPVSIASEIYFNGRLMGSRGKIGSGGEILAPNSAFMLYQIPAASVKAGAENVVAIRVGQYQRVGGLFGNNYLYAGEYTQARDHYMVLLLGIVILGSAFIILGVYHLILYFGRRIETEFLYFSLIAITSGMHQLGMNGIGYHLTESRTLNQILIHLVTAGLPVSLVGFATKFFDLRAKWPERIFLYSGILVALVLVLQQVIPSLYGIQVIYILPFSMLMIMASLIVFTVLVVKAFRLKRHGAMLVGSGFLLYMLTVAHDILAYLTLPVEYRLGNIGFLIPVFGMATALAQKIQRMHREKELTQQQAIENLKKADVLKDEFLANTSHELRTPLNGIIGLAESLVNGATGPLRENTMENLELIVSSGRRLSSLVDDILDFSRMKNNELRLHIEPLAVEPQVSLVLQLSEPLLQGKPVALKKEIPPDLPLLLGDHARLQQVLHNLVGNAIKFTAAGSVRVRAWQDGETEVAIAVEDTGIGIAAEDLGRIFNAFEQVDSADNRRFGGTGLGLTVTKRLVELQGGRIEACSQAGQGSVFTVYFPIARGTATIREAVKPILSKFPASRPVLLNDDVLVEELQAAGVPSHGKVLAIDDEQINLRILQNMLTLNGYECITASGGKEAIALLESMQDEELPDVVLLDVMMPEMTGYEVCQRIREKYPVQTLPVIMLTAKREEKDIVKGFQSGANDYLTKPFYQDELTSRVNTLYMLKAAVRRDQQLLSLEKELEIARQMQASLLPKKTIEHLSYDISWFFRPMLSVGGDLLDVQQSREGDLCFLIADVCGHGIGAAMVTSMVKLTFLMSHRLMHEPAAMLKQMNETLAMILGGTFVTAAVVHLSANGRQIRFARAGHPPLLHYEAQSGKVAHYQLPGKPMGDFPGNSEFLEQSIAIAPGDMLMLYTDGVTEAENTSGEMYGDRLHAFLASQGGNAAAQISQQLVSQLDKQIAPRTEHADDIAYVVIKVK